MRRQLAARRLLASGVEVEVEIATQDAGTVMQQMSEDTLTQELAHILKRTLSACFPSEHLPCARALTDENCCYFIFYYFDRQSRAYLRRVPLLCRLLPPRLPAPWYRSRRSWRPPKCLTVPSALVCVCVCVMPDRCLNFGVCVCVCVCVHAHAHARAHTHTSVCNAQMQTYNANV